MTAVTENTENVATPNGVEPTEPVVKYPTYLQLAKAVWHLAYRLAYVEDAFCSDGANEYLSAFGLPALVPTDDNEELKDRYLEAWFGFTHFTATPWTEQDDARERARLVTRLRRKLQRDEPKSVTTMNEWLTELGLETFAPPAPPRHAGNYNVSYDASTEVNSARLAEALRERFPTLNVQVSYQGRVS